MHKPPQNVETLYKAFKSALHTQTHVPLKRKCMAENTKHSREFLGVLFNRVAFDNSLMKFSYVLRIFVKTALKLRL